MTQHEHWRHTGIIPAAEFIQDPDYTEHPSRSARIAGLCAVGASATFVIALGWWLFGGVGS